MKITTRLLPGSASLAIAGDIDQTSLERFREAIGQVVDHGTPSIVIDLSAVTYIDSAGVSALYELADRDSDHRTIEITGLSTPVRRILDISGFGEQEGVRLSLADDLAAQVEPQRQSTACLGGSRSWTRTYPSHLEQLALLRNFVQEVAEDTCLGSEETFDLKVSVSEAAANAIEHGGSEGELVVRATRTAGRLAIILSHPGAFKARLTDDPSRRHRGMGLPLMLALVDEVTISRPRVGGTRVVLSVYLR